MKKLINTPESYVDDVLAGMSAAYPEHFKIDGESGRVLRRPEPVVDKVGVVSGGGFGHIPVFAGYVGDGLVDGMLCDGDRGVTLINGFNHLSKECDTLPEDVGQALLASAKAITSVSGSSFGTRMATALMAAGKIARGRNEVEWAEITDLLQAAQEAMIARGGASLGDKTMFDSMDAIITSVKAASQHPDQMLEAAASAADRALEEFRDKPNKIGRARVYSEKSIGLNDPGMMAMKRLVGALRP